MKIFKKTLFLTVISFALSLFIFAPKVQAGSFDPGRIIDNGIFINKASMSVGDIQNFLISKVPTCDTWHTAGPSAQGAVPPWTCLKDYYENTSTGANNLNGQPVPSGAISAAQIIYDAAQTYSINPQVLIVTLQKENGLITDTWPYPWQYRTAMGFACPDNGTCDPAYYGFYKQVNQAARHFRNFYDLNPNWYIPFRPGVSYIQYNPNASCGGTNVNITNNATAALYSYTPYQPNAAALSNLYGTGDSCSSYGNRNFWRYFNDWFGTSLSAPYQWSIVSQIYSNGNTNIVAGERETITLVVKNTGTKTWTNSGSNPVRLGTWNPGRQSIFKGTSWLTADRTANLQESSVAPGQNGTFIFNIQAPSQVGMYQERFNLVAENLTWLNDNGMYYTFNVQPGTFSGQLISSNLPTSINTNATQQVVLQFKNTGNVAWYNDGSFPIRLGTYNPVDHNSNFYSTSWLSSTRLAVLQESGGVWPGQTGSFVFNIKSPSIPGMYSDTFSLIADNFAWFNQPVYFSSQVGLTYQWQLVSLNYSNGSSLMDPGTEQTVTATVKNIGTATWQKNGSNPVKLGTWLPDRMSSTKTDSWPSWNRPASLQEDAVTTGQNGTFVFNVRMPNIGDYTERFNLVSENLKWFDDTGASYRIQSRSNYSWQIISQEYSNGSVNITKGSEVTLTLKVKNTGDITWQRDSGFPIRLGTSQPYGRGSVLYDQGSWLSNTRPAKLQEESVAPGQIGTYIFKINTAIAPLGARQEYFSLVAEGLRWLPDNGLYYYLNFK